MGEFGIAAEAGLARLAAVPIATQVEKITAKTNQGLDNRRFVIWLRI
jgi:hypothetical protein